MILEDWLEIPYQSAVEKQLDLVEQVHSGSKGNTIVFCTHPPIVTIGRGTQPDDVFAWQGEILETSRGGRATYHGPNQQVIYPIISLIRERNNLKPKDLHAYLRALERATILTLKEFGVLGETKEAKNQNEDLHYTGVWVKDQKIASIGIAVKKWVSYHGVAINLENDPKAFTGINPCGFTTKTMTSVENIIQKKVNRMDFKNTAFVIFKSQLS